MVGFWKKGWMLFGFGQRELQARLAQYDFTWTSRFWLHFVVILAPKTA